MSDTAAAETTAPVETAAPEPAASAQPAPAPAPTAETAPATAAPAPSADPSADPFDDQQVTTFDRGYVEKLRQENAARRTELAVFKEAYDGVDEDDRAVWLELAKLYATDPAAAGKWMLENGQFLIEAAAPATTDNGPGDESELDQPIRTVAELEQYLAKREETKATQAARDAAADAVMKEIHDAGFTDEADSLWILQTAQKNGTDVGPAIAAFQQRLAGREAIEAMKNDANGAAHTPPQTGAASGTVDDLGPLGSSKFRDGVRARITAAQQ